AAGDRDRTAAADGVIDDERAAVCLQRAGIGDRMAGIDGQKAGRDCTVDREDSGLDGAASFVVERQRTVALPDRATAHNRIEIIKGTAAGRRGNQRGLTRRAVEAELAA